MAYIDPKTDWSEAYQPSTNDMNRIEGDIEYIHDTQVPNVQSNLDTEESARISADNTLQDNIDSEASTRASADNTLQGNIDSEESARISADNTLTSEKAGLTDDNVFTGDNNFSNIICRFYSLPDYQGFYLSAGDENVEKYFTVYYPISAYMGLGIRTDLYVLQAYTTLGYRPDISRGYDDGYTYLALNPGRYNIFLRARTGETTFAEFRIIGAYGKNTTSNLISSLRDTP